MPGRTFAAGIGLLVCRLAAGATGGGGGAAIEGRVTDDSGQPLPGATVEARCDGQPSAAVTATGADGRYRLEVPATVCDVSFRLMDFGGGERRRLATTAGAAARADATLRLSVSADVVVTGKRTLRSLAEATAPGESLLGIADASSEGVVVAEQIDNRAIARPGDVLETVPGVVVTQHSGEGKANQYYLRGFNLDHGTDFATAVAGMPVNLPSHAHGQGYTDLNFVIPELVSGIQYKKGPYFAEDGDFTTAGSARVDYANVLDRSIARAEGGSFGFARALFAGSPKLGEGRLLYALEGARDDGPWEKADRFRKWNGVLRYSVGDERSGLALTAMGYDARWDATDQIPDRAVADGTVGRFGTLDPTDGGSAHRYSLSGEYRRSDAVSATRAEVYAIDSRLDLFSNFTYFLEHPDTGDQFEQLDDRNVYGLAATHRWLSSLFGADAESEIGVQGRFDDVRRIGLYRTEARVRLATSREDGVREASGSVFFQNETAWTGRFRTILGVRGDLYRFDVNARSDPENGGAATRGIFSPKLSLVFGPFGRTEIYANAGYGFHSNDARGATIAVDPATGAPAERVTPLARAKAAELGLRSLPLPGWQSTLAVWGLDLASELVFLGDAGTTEPSRPSRRYGVEWSNEFRARPWLTFDADVAFSRARFRDGDAAGDRIPGAVETVVSAGVAADRLGPLSGSVRVRYFGPRDLVEDGSVRSKASTTVNAALGYEVLRGARLQLEVFNLFDAKVSDIDYYYASRLAGEPAAGVEDLHSHPAAPRSARVGVAWGF